MPDVCDSLKHLRLARDAIDRVINTRFHDGSPLPDSYEGRMLAESDEIEVRAHLSEVIRRFEDGTVLEMVTSDTP